MTKSTTSKLRSAAKAPANRYHSANLMRPPADSASEIDSVCQSTEPNRPMDFALQELISAIGGMEELTGAESAALDAVLDPGLEHDDAPGPPIPESKLAAQITRFARRIENCNAYRRARLARIDLPRG